MESAPQAFHDLTIRDPLFATEGMDLDNATASTDALESALQDLELEYAGKSLARKLFFIRYPLTQYAVPISFLRAVIASERARRTYLAETSFESAHSLVGAWEHAAQCLSNDLRRYHALHEIVVRLEFDPEKFVMQDMFGHLTTYRYVRKMLNTFKRNAAVLSSEVAERRKLLGGGVASVSSQPKRGAALLVLKSAEISPENKRFHEAEIAGGVSPYRYADIVESHGPLRVELAALDETPRERTFILYILKERGTGRRCMWPAFVDEFHFIDIWHMMDVWRTAPKTDAITRGKYASAVGLAKDDLPFWYEGIAFLYNTRDTRYWMEIGAAVDARRRPELDWKIAAVQKSSLFDLLLAECARDTRSMMAHLRRRVRSDTSVRYSLFYDFLTRTYPSVYYMPFNGSIWRIPEESFLIGDGFKAPPEDKFLSEERMRKELTPEVLQKVMSVAKLREERGQQAGWLPVYGET